MDGWKWAPVASEKKGFERKCSTVKESAMEKESTVKEAETTVKFAGSIEAFGDALSKDWATAENYSERFVRLIDEFMTKYEITAYNNEDHVLWFECSETNYMLIKLTCPEYIYG